MNRTQLIRLAKISWKEACLRKWGYYCEVCGKMANTVHHYIPKSKNGSMRYEVLNGVPVCKKCHFLIHFSHNPDVSHGMCETIRRRRGKEWCAWLDKRKREKEKWNSMPWLKEVIKKLRNNETI